MRLQHVVEVQVAIGAAVEALATLSRNAQALSVRRALGNARLELALHAVHESLLVVFGHCEVEIDFGAVIRLVERDVRDDLVVLAAKRPLLSAPTRATAAAAQRFEEIREIEVVERELLLAEM